MLAEKRTIEHRQIVITMTDEEASDLVELLQTEKNRRYGEKLIQCWTCYDICVSLLQSLNTIGVIAIGTHDKE